MASCSLEFSERSRDIDLVSCTVNFADGGEVDVSVKEAGLSNSSSVSRSISKNNGRTNMYKPSTSPKYGSVLARTPDIPYTIQNHLTSKEFKAECDR